MTDSKKIAGDLNEAASLINGSFDVTESLTNILMGQPELVSVTLAEAENNFGTIERKILEGNATVSVELWEKLRISYRDQVDKWKNHITQK